MFELIATVILTPLAAWVALPAIVDLAATFRGWRGNIPPGQPRTKDEERLVFLIPAHDEGLLIERCVKSLLSIDYPDSRRRVVAIADNCTDDTSTRARAAGAEVLERSNTALRGKGHAIEWALHELRDATWDAVIVIDADTIVRPDFGRELSRWSPLRGQALQTYDTASNEFETWLTRLAGLLARSRYGLRYR